MCVESFKRDSTRDGEKEQVKPAERISRTSRSELHCCLTLNLNSTH